MNPSIVGDETQACRAGAKSSLWRDVVAPVLGEMHSLLRSAAPQIESFLQQPADASDQSKSALRLLSEEIKLRRAAGEKIEIADLLRRFPACYTELSNLYAGLEAPAAPADFFVPEDPHGTFELLDALGSGAEGQVFLARQPDLANRLVVLKIAPARGQEHLSLARLQHTNIVPLFSVYQDRQHERRALCMPYFGRLTLKHVLRSVAKIPWQQRQGQDLFAEMESGDGPARTYLSRCTYEDAICWIGASLADGLHYAHERGLVHLDVKPSNVLLANDGQPMLLDFHLARPPVAKGQLPPFALGGTPPYMAPELLTACAAVEAGERLEQGVDGRADVYALGALLYEALVGEKPSDDFEQLPTFAGKNPRVSPGLADIVHKCLAPLVTRRYQTAHDVAVDLRRHLEHRPLVGVANRSWKERYQKWRRRRPFALPLCILSAVCVVALLSVGVLTMRQIEQRRQLAEDLLFQGQQHLQQRHYPQAVSALAEGLKQAAALAGSAALQKSLAHHLALAERASKAEQLHKFADHLRLLMVGDDLDQRTLVVLEVGCKSAWEQRTLLPGPPALRLDPRQEQTIRRDLLELALGWAEVHVKWCRPENLALRRREALEILDEASRLCGPNPALTSARAALASAVDEAVAPADTNLGWHPANSWEHYVLGRSLLRTGKLAEAATALEKSLAQEPGDFWANFCLGECAARLKRHHQAVACFSVCLGQAPTSVECLARRGHAHAALDEWGKAFADADYALQIRPNITELLMARGRACIHLGRVAQARDDLLQAQSQGGDADEIHTLLKALPQNTQKPGE